MADDNLKTIFDQVADVVDDAISQSNYSALSDQIADLMGDVAELASRGFQSKGQEAARKEAARRAQVKAAKEALAAKEREKKRLELERADKYFVRPVDVSGSKVLAAIGGFGAAFFGVCTLMVGSFSTAVGGFIGAMTQPMAVLTGLLTAAGIAMFAAGRVKVRKNTRFASYRKLLLPKLYSDVKDLAVEMNLPEKEVVKDLKGFSKSGMIREGHFDDRETTFIASNELYEQYRATVKHEAKKAPKAEAAKEPAIPESVREILEQGSECISMIHDANANIPDPDITEKLNRMEEIVRKIFDEVRERPELADKLNTFMTYYLPTATKLVHAYEEMDSQPVQGANIQKAKKEIANSLGTINDAFETLLDSFFLTQAEDVQSDISVMKMMMQQQGLAPDELTAMRRKQDASMKAAMDEARAREDRISSAAKTGTSGNAHAVSTGGGAQAQYMEEQ